MRELTLQQVADLFGCHACVNKYEEDRILLFDRHPYYNKDSGTYGGRCVGWLRNVAQDTMPRAVVPAEDRRPRIRQLVDGLGVTLVIGPEQTVMHNGDGGPCGAIATKSLLFGIGVVQDEGKIVCHSQYDVALQEAGNE